MHIKTTLLFRYGVVGASTALLDWSLLYFFTDILQIYYLFSQFCALLLVIAVNFTGQKYWTFRNFKKEQLRKQILSYLALALFNLCFNTLLMYVFVDLLGFWYVYSQIAATFIIASFTFFMYRYFIFA
jgi:putative flippase GtrA